MLLITYSINPACLHLYTKKVLNHQEPFFYYENKTKNICMKKTVQSITKLI